jgi:hypothetical protein
MKLNDSNEQIILKFKANQLFKIANKIQFS